LDQTQELIRQTLDSEFVATAKESFDRISYDGETICTEDELQNLATAMEFKYSEYLVLRKNSEEHNKVMEVMTKRVEDSPVTFDEFVAWYNKHFRGIKLPEPEPVAPEQITSSLATFGVPLVAEDCDYAVLERTETQQPSRSERTETQQPSRSDRAPGPATIPEDAEVNVATMTATASGTKTSSNRISAARERLSSALSKRKKDRHADASGEQSESSAAEANAETATAASTSTSSTRSNAARLLLEKRRQRAAETKATPPPV